MSTFRHITPREITENPFTLIGEEWMLISASCGNHCNTMTASWGGIGVLWNKPVTFTFVRPERYTHTLLQESNTYSLAFLPESYRNALRYCGTHSGREGDKFAAAGLTVAYENGIPYPAEARLVLLCRKLHTLLFSQSQFTDSTLLSHYKTNGFHRQYVGEILDVLQASP